MLFKAKVAAEDEAMTVQDALPVAEVVAALGAIANSEDLGTLEGLPPLLAESLRNLRVALAGRDEQILSQTVEYSMQASQAMAATARITGEIRETDARAQGMAAGVEELTASIDQIASTAREAAESMEAAHGAMQSGADATRGAAQASRRIGESFGRMNSAADQLAEAADQIGTFVATIDGLAQQTNLLALNATIEAARAGDAGKGFAVVASEVKVLSGQTQKATDDIRARIERLEAHVKEVLAAVTDVQGLVSQSVEKSEGAEQQISEVNANVEANSARMSEIAHVLRQQSEAVQEISGGVHVIADHARNAADYAGEVINAVGSCEKIITAQFADLEPRNIPRYVLHRAKSDHLLWKKHLAEMLVGLKSLREDELANHHQCRLGKWYDAVTEEGLKAHPAFVALLPVHEAVHTHGREAARRYASGDRTGALEAAAAMDQASVKVLEHLTTLLKA